MAGDPHTYLFWGKKAGGAVRKGKWKLVDLPPNPIELYNLRLDINEKQNVAAPNGEIVAELRAARTRWAAQLAPPLW